MYIDSIQFTDKAGNVVPDDETPININASYFWVTYGDFVLELPNSTWRTTTRGWARVRNYEGQERYVPKRMLQRIEFPWGIAQDIETIPDGVPLPLRFFRQDTTGTGGCPFVAEEAVMEVTPDAGTEDDAIVLVVDHDMNYDSVPKTQTRLAGRRTVRSQTLEERWPEPWNFLVSQEALNDWNAEVLSTEEGPDDNIDVGRGGAADKGKGEAADKGKGKEPAQEEGGAEGKKLGVLNTGARKVIKCGRKRGNGTICKNPITVEAGGYDNGCSFHPNADRMAGYDELNNKL